MKIGGRVWKYGDNINTDYIFPGPYTYQMLTFEQMGEHAMEGIDPRFVKEVQPGDIIVAGKNWGCGSSREQAVKSLKACGLGGIIAEGVSRIYFRNSINEGLPVIICPEAVDAINEGDHVMVDFEEGTIEANGKKYHFEKYPSYLEELIKHGGVIAYTRKKLEERGKL